MQQATETSPGIFDTARAFAHSLLEHVQTRVELLTVEWAEEKTRLAGLLVTVAFALFFSFLAVTFGSLLIVVLYWDTANRIAVMTGLVIFYVIAALVAWVLVRTRMKVKSSLFATSAAELHKDRQLLESSS